MTINITVPTSSEEHITVSLSLPVNAFLDDLHDDIEKYVKCEECISYSDGIYRKVPIYLDGCVTTENYLNIFDVSCGQDNNIKARLSFS